MMWHRVGLFPVKAFQRRFPAAHAFCQSVVQQCRPGGHRTDEPSSAPIRVFFFKAEGTPRPGGVRVPAASGQPASNLFSPGPLPLYRPFLDEETMKGDNWGGGGVSQPPPEGGTPGGGVVQKARVTIIITRGLITPESWEEESDV